MPGNDVFLLDTNILVYAHGIRDDKKHRIAENIIDRCLKNEIKLAVSSQNLSEFFSVTTEKGFLAKKDAADIISDIAEFSGWIKLDFSHKTVLDAARMSEEHNMSYWDSLLAATMKLNGILSIYTENTKDFKVPWIRAVNPF